MPFVNAQEALPEPDFASSGVHAVSPSPDVAFIKSSARPRPSHGAQCHDGLISSTQTDCAS
eukprot:6209368-Pleurochrysis_carterae.AAC.1